MTITFHDTDHAGGILLVDLLHRQIAISLELVDGRLVWCLDGLACWRMRPGLA